MENRHCSDVIKEGDEFVIYSFDGESSIDFNRLAFDDMEVASNFRRGSEVLTSEQRATIEEATKPESFLQSLVKAEGKEKEKLPAISQKDIDTIKDSQTPELIYGMTVDEYEEKFKKVKKDFKKKRKAFEDQARNALLEAAKLYLGDKHTEAYVAYKLKLNQSGLGSIMYQIHTMEETLHSLASRIKVAGAHLSSRDVEVFTGLQRIILDAQKFQFDYLQSVEQALKDVKVDLEIAGGNGAHDKHDEEGEMFYFRGNKEFIKQLAELKNTMHEFAPTPSKNKKLNPNAEVVDIQYEETKGEGSALGSERNPFSGYEGAPKRPKKRNENDEYGDDDDDE